VITEILIIKAILLGIVEGITEFIPVSSTAHLLLASKLIDFSSIKNGVFEVVIQVGAICAVCVLYRKKLFDAVVNFYHQKSSRDFIFNIIIAFIPAVIFGLLLYSIIKLVFFSPAVIAWALIIGGIAIIIIEKSNLKPKCYKIDQISKLQALYIGLFQVLAMVPGVSRSGATIMGGLILKLDRKTATEFSFFLSIPTIFAASIYDFYKNYESLEFNDLGLIFIGFLSAFISSIILIKWFINFISKHNFMAFAYYRIIAGLVLIFVLYGL
jgi:undecaprenyl-diphosphatase